MKSGKDKAIITFRTGNNILFDEWRKEFNELYELRKYLRDRKILLVSLRVELKMLNRTITTRSFLSPQEITDEQFHWLKGRERGDHRFISVNLNLAS